MSNDNTTQLTPETEVAEAAVEEVAEVSENVVVVPVAKTRKELKKERKAIKKHKKEVKKEAMLHSAKTTKAFNFMVTVVSLLVVFTMIFCSVTAIKITTGIGQTASSDNSGNAGAAGNAGGSAAGNAGGGAAGNAGGGAAGNAGGSADGGAAGDGAVVEDAGDPNDVTSKAGAVELYKRAHAKVLSEATSVTRTLDNNTNYKEYLEVGGNSALAGVAKTLMGMFLVANEEPIVHSGADIAANFPPTAATADGLTAAMIGDYSVTEEGDFYIVTLTLNSSEENPDLGDNAQHLINIVEAKTVEEAAAGFVGFTGLRNEYIAPSITAKINKTTEQMVELHTICPSYMKFDRATVMSIINVDNVGIGLQYETKWTVQY